MFVIVLINTYKDMNRTYRNTSTGSERIVSYTPVKLKGFSNTYKDSNGNYFALGLLGLAYLHPANYELIEY